MIKLKYSIILVFIVQSLFSQVNKPNGGPCKFTVYNDTNVVWHWGSLPSVSGNTLYICPNDSIILHFTYTGSNCSCISPQWRKNGANVPNATSYYYSVVDTGLYSININCSPFGLITLDSIVCVQWCSLAGIHENSKVDFLVYPNPANNSLIIKQLHSPNSKLIIYNSLNEVMLTTKLRLDFEEIDISNLVSGMYYISIDNGRNVITRKIIKILE